VTSHLFENEFRRAAPRASLDPNGGRVARGGQTCRSAARGMAPFSNTLLSLARPVDGSCCMHALRVDLLSKAKHKATAPFSGSKFNERALRRAIRELRGTRGWSTSRVHVYVHT